MGRDELIRFGLSLCIDGDGSGVMRLYSEQVPVLVACILASRPPEGGSADCVELGVYRGGSAAVIAAGMTEGTLHLIDTFYGMPDTMLEEETEKLWSGAHQGPNRDEVLRRVESREGMSVVIHGGVFPDGISLSKLPESISFAHFDADIYRSCVAFIEYIVPRLNSEYGLALFHDYGEPNCPGVARAVGEAWSEYALAEDHIRLREQRQLVVGSKTAIERFRQEYGDGSRPCGG